MTFNVFFSWQSDRDRKCNWSVIEDALERAAKVVAADDTVEIVPVVDRDTAGLPGSPEISAAIFDKIEASSLFVADVSLITDPGSRRPSSNPNVLVELGYAARALGWDRVVLVANTHWGAVEQLPFDLRHRRVTKYCMAPEDQPAGARAQLAKAFEVAMRAVHAAGPRVPVAAVVEQPATFSTVSSFVTSGIERTLHLHRPVSMLCKAVAIGPADGVNAKIPLTDLLAHVAACRIDLQGWGGDDFPHGEYPNVQTIRMPSSVEQFDTTAWPGSTASYWYWRFDASGHFVQVNDLAEDNSGDGPNAHTGRLGAEWALLDIARAFMFAARIRARLPRLGVLAVRFHWQLGQGRTLLLADRRRVGFLQVPPPSALPAWNFEATLASDDDISSGVRAAGESLFWQFGWERGMERFLSEFTTPILAGRFPG